MITRLRSGNFLSGKYLTDIIPVGANQTIDKSNGEEMVIDG